MAEHGLTAEERQAVAEVYAAVDAAVARANPRCDISGRCCRFEPAGHQLWASSLELAFAREAAGSVPAAPPGACPWHVGGLCTLRAGRPLGCRTYFCDPAWTAAGQELHEASHQELVALHERFGRAYRYERFVDAVRRAPAPGGAPA